VRHHLTAECVNKNGEWTKTKKDGHGWREAMEQFCDIGASVIYLIEIKIRAAALNCTNVAAKRGPDVSQVVYICITAGLGRDDPEC
jgi:hypothetical protein